MDQVATWIFMLGAGIASISYLLMVIQVFKESILLGLLSLLIPLVILLQVISNFKHYKKPFLLFLLGILISSGGIVLSP